MSVSKPAAWVTQALCREEVEAALVLAKSLKKTFTRGFLVVLVNPCLMQSLIEALGLIFDFVLPLKYWEFNRRISSASLCLLHARSLSFFDKCIFLPPFCMAMRNADGFFDATEINEQSPGNLSENNDYLLKNDWYEYPLLLNPSGVTPSSFNKGSINIKDLESEEKNLEAILCGIEIQEEMRVLKNTKLFCSISLGSVVSWESLEEVAIVSLNFLKDVNFGKATLKNMDGMISGKTTWFYTQWTDLLKTIDHPSGPASTPMPYLESAVEPIAIIGMACRLPSAKNIAEFWNILESGADAVKHPPRHRWTNEQYPHIPTGAESTQAGFLSVPIDEFDAKFFEISPKDAICMDPQQRLLLEIVWETFEDAGINPQEMRGSRGGVFLGNWLNDYKEILQSDSLSSDFYRTYKGNCVGAGAAKVSHLLGWTGPCIGLESDCAAGLTSVHMACKSLQNQECSIALACGVNLLLKPFTLDTIPSFCSPGFRCKTFDASADGYVRAEGCAVVLLKRYSDALQNNDNIWGLIRGTGASHEGTSYSMGSPTVACQIEAMRKALEDGKITAAEISYVEAHGTGTAVGDPIEMESIAKVYGRGVTRKGPLTIGSVKTNIGHTESCSGITGIIKVILSMWNEQIPSHKHFKQLNPAINLEEMKACIPLEPVPWPKIFGEPRLAGVSSFGISGKNCHVIVQEPPAKKKSAMFTFERQLHIMKISAKSEFALSNLLEMYLNFFKELNETQNYSTSFANIVHTANVGRANFQYRAVIIAENAESAYSILKSGNVPSKQATIIEKDCKEICFLFTGQGCQYPGMGKTLYETSPIFRIHFDFCNEWLKLNYNLSIKEKMFQTEAKNHTEDQSVYVHLSIFILEYCLMKLWQSWGVRPKYILGHSLGESCAAVCAGIMTIEDALTLVTERGLLIDQLPAGKMLVVNANRETVEKLQEECFMCQSDKLDYAAFNTDDQTVISGCPKNVLLFEHFLSKKAQIKNVLLPAKHAFHSRCMDPILEKLRNIAERIKYSKPNENVTFISGLLGTHSSVKVDAEYWIRHTRDPVNFIQASKIVTETLKCITFLEVSPHPILSAFVKTNCKKDEILCLPSLRRSNRHEWKTMFESLGKLYLDGISEINWSGLDQGYAREKIGHVLPFYPFTRTKYWPKINSSPFVFTQGCHPLLGSKFSNSSSTEIFQSIICTSNNSLEYLKDHALGTKTLFPGAGFIEMMLAAGTLHCFGLKTQSQQSFVPVQLNNFKIHSPLQINDDGVLCQTILCPTVNSRNDQASSIVLQLEIYHQGTVDDKDNLPEWIKHASAEFLLSTFNNTKETKEGKNELQSLIGNYKKVEKVLDMIKNVQSNGIVKDFENISKTMYQKYHKIGLNLGPSFQTLRRAWLNKQEDKRAFLAEVEVADDIKKYVLHPLVVDAMIQAAVFSDTLLNSDTENVEDADFNVPVGCHNFVLLKPLKSQRCFIYFPNHDLQSTLLFDEECTLVAVLYKVISVQTTTERIESALEALSKPFPQLYETKWIKVKNSYQFDSKPIPDMVEKARNMPHIYLTKEEEEFKKDSTRLVSLYIFKAMINLGWTISKGNKISWNRIVANISKNHYKVFRHFLGFLVEDGVLKRSQENAEEMYENIMKIPSLMEITLEVESLIYKHCSVTDGQPGKIDFNQVPIEHVPILLLKEIGETLHDILKGNESVLPILYKGSALNGNTPASRYYEVVFAKIIKVFTTLITQHFQALKISAMPNGDKIVPTYRILEVGAGTGCATKQILESLDQVGLPFEYVYTDISPNFFPSAENKFKKFADNMSFKKLDIEQDTIGQGFPPKYFDMIVAFNVIHATRNIQESLENIKKLIKHDGILWMNETIRQDRLMDCLFGLLNGFWRFEDTELRDHHCMLSVEKWEKVTKGSGIFSDFHCVQADTLGLLVCRSLDKIGYPANNLQNPTLPLRNESEGKNGNFRWLVLTRDEDERIVKLLLDFFKYIGLERKQVGVIRNVNKFSKSILTKPKKIEGIILTWAIALKNEDLEEIANVYLSFQKTLMELPAELVPPTILLTKGQFPVSAEVCLNPSSLTLIGMTINAFNKQKTLNLRVADIDPSGDLQKSLWPVFQDLFSSLDRQVPPISVYRKEGKFIFKLNAKEFSPTLSLSPAIDRFQILPAMSKPIENPQFTYLPPYLPRSNQIEIKIESIALNKLCVRNSNEIGLGFAGIVKNVGSCTKKFNVGDAVFGTHLELVQNHLQVNEETVQSIPASFSFAEAASLATDFAVVYIALVQLTHAKKGETLLINQALDGIGLLAMQIAKELGLNIICTAKSEKIIAYIKDTMGFLHVFSCMDPDLHMKIIEVTRNQGVDIVVNFSTGPEFKEAAFKVCGKGARIVEMTETDTHSAEDFNKVRPDIQVLSFNSKILRKGCRVENLMQILSNWMKNGKIHSIPLTRFDAGDIHNAFNYLQNQNHVGKVVISTNYALKPDGKMNKNVYSVPIFNERSTYLITGRIERIGLELCKYMLQQNAQNIVLVDQSCPSRQGVQALDNMRKLYTHCSIKVVQGNLGDWTECKKVFEEISKGLPPLRGIMHLAPYLSNNSATHAQTLLQSSISSTWNLHKCTSKMNLEYFVIFSSAASKFGCSRKICPVVSSMWNDNFAHYRRSLGLPTTSVSWELWEEKVNRAVQEKVINPLKPSHGIKALDVILRKNQFEITIANLNETFVHTADSLPFTKWLLNANFVKSRNVSTHSLSIANDGINMTSDKFCKEFDNSTLHERRTVIKKYLELILHQVLRLDPNDEINEDADFSTLGLDSLMMMEVVNLIHALCGKRVSISQSRLKNCRTLNGLSKVLER